MTIRISTATRNGLLDQTGIAEQFLNGIIEVRTGAQPASADDAASGTLLGTFTDNGGAFTPGTATNGLQFEAAANGSLTKLASQTWKFTAVAAGTAGWFRFKGNAADNDAASTTLTRLDGSIATAGADMNMTSTTVAIGSPHTLDTFSLSVNASN